MNDPSESLELAICVRAQGYDDLQQRKIYQILPDDKAAERNYVRVVDDSGEDYLYPGSCFIFFQFPERIVEQLALEETAVA